MWEQTGCRACLSARYTSATATTKLPAAASSSPVKMMIMMAVLLAGEPTAFPQVFSPPASSALSLVHWLTNSAASARRSCTLCSYPNSTTANPYNRVSQGTACCTPCPASPSTAETFACLSSAAYAGCGGGCVKRPLTHPVRLRAAASPPPSSTPCSRRG